MSSRQEEDERIKQRERQSRTTHVPNLGGPRVNVTAPAAADPNQRQSVWAKQPAAPQPSTAPAPTAANPWGSSSSTQPVAAVPPPAPAAANPWGSSSSTQPVAAMPSPAPIAANPWGSSSSSTTPPVPAVPTKMTRQEEDLRNKQREREARAASRVVPNLAHRMKDSPAPSGPGSMSTKAVGPPAAAAPVPAAKPVPVPRKMSRQEEDLMMKQREREARGMAKGARASVVPNLASMMNDTPGPQAAVAPAAVRPAVPTKMSRQEEDLKMKQREREARGMASGARASVVPNLASMMNDTPGAQAGAAPAAAVRPAVPTKMSRQEEDLRMKQREREARGMASGARASVVPNLARMMNDTPGPQAAVAPAAAVRPSVPTKMSRQEEDLMMKQRERESRGMATGARASVVPNLASMMNDTPGAQAVRPGPQLVGAPAAVRPAPTRKLSRQEEDAMTKQRERESRGMATGGRSSVVANLASRMDDAPAPSGPAAVPAKMTKQEEELKIKQRERASRGVATSRVVPNLAAQVTDSGTAITENMSQEEKDKLAKGGDVPTDNSDLVDESVDVTPGQQSLDRERDDAVAKSRGRRARRSDAVNTAASVVAVEEEEPQMLPGALAVRMGGAEHRERFVLTQQPDHGSLRDLLIHEEPIEVEEDKEQAVAACESADVEVGTTDGIIEGTTVGVVEEAALVVACEDNETSEEKETPTRKWIWIAAVLLVIVIIGGVGGALAGGGGGDEPLPPSVVTDRPKETEPPKELSERAKAISPLLAGVISSAEALKDDSSPQFKALVWVADEDSLSFADDEKLQSRYILAVFYYSLDGPNWVDSSDWLDGGQDECAWERLECDQNGLVTDITEETAVNIIGMLPSELQHLVALDKIVIANNGVSGLAGPLKQLTHLQLDNNGIRGKIPSPIYEMTNLDTLTLYENLLTGSISADIGNLVNMNHLDLASNELTGTLTTELHPLKRLDQLKISDNELEGSLSEVLEGLPALRAIFAQRNSFKGSIDPFFAELTNLQRFEVEDNALSGSFPNFIWNATALGTLDLGYNSFSGTLSTDIGLAVGLQILHLRRIGLTGTIPTEIATLDRLREFALEFNEFEGPIPSEIGNLNSLDVISLQSNYLTGPIPSEIGELNKLSYLFLDANLLNSTVPDALGELRDLVSIRLAGNEEISGNIPSEMCDFQRLEQIQFERTDIVCGCGPPLC